MGQRISSTKSVGPAPPRSASTTHALPASGGSARRMSEVRTAAAAGMAARTCSSAFAFQRPYSCTGAGSASSA